MTTISSCRLLLLFMSCALTMVPGPITPVRAQTGIVTVNDEPITEDEIEKRSQFDVLTTHKQPKRQDVINELAEDKREIEEAERQGIGPTSADVDGAFAQMCSRMRVTPEQLTKSLEGQGIHLDTLKQRIKADMARANLRTRR